MKQNTQNILTTVGIEEKVRGKQGKGSVLAAAPLQSFSHTFGYTHQLFAHLIHGWVQSELGTGIEN